jgi:hypothetical protein
MSALRSVPEAYERDVAAAKSGYVPSGDEVLNDPMMGWLAPESIGFAGTMGNGVDNIVPVVSSIGAGVARTGDAFDEAAFRDWYSRWSKITGISPNPDDPEHYYDYRAAFNAGVSPQIDPEDGRYHWPSEFKREGHPRLIIDGVDTRTMKKVQ